MRPLYIVGTERNVGKTTLCIGLISALRDRGLRVAYTKPLGQRVSSVDGRPVHDDALVVSQVLNMTAAESVAMAVPLTRGRVEREIYDLRTPEMAERVATACRRLRQEHDLVIVEGMGHVATGACLGLSAAEIARILGAKTMMVSGGGIGRTIDAIALCATFLGARGAELTGAVVNKVWPEKFRRVKEATAKGMDNLGIQALGAVPYDQILAAPTVRQVCQEVDGEVLCGGDALDNRVQNTVVAAMEPHHMVSYLKNRSLVITPGDRSDNILAIISTYMLTAGSEAAVAGVILTGGFRPTGKVMELICECGLPVIMSRGDTYTLAARMREIVFKITPDDKERIETAMRVVNEYVDVDAILETLRE